MQNYSDIVLFNGQPLSGASVSVLNYPAGTLATIYIDNGITTGPNPITTNVNGRYNFYAANGRYSLQIAYPNTTTQTILDFPLEDDPANPGPANINGGTITNVAISNSSLTNTTAVTQGTLDNTTLVATDAFVNNQIVRSKATTPVAITGGTYNLNVTGTGLSFVIFVVSGVISSVVSVISGGTGYAVGDTLVVAGGNVDAVVRITNVIGGVVQSGGVQVLYGGTGYTTGATVPAVKAGVNGGNTITLTGTLTSNATIIFVRGTQLTGSTRILINNNTTGAFTVSAFMSNGSGGTTGSGVVIPQGTNNSTSMQLETDGMTDVWSATSATTTLTTTGAFTPSQTAGIVGTTTNNNVNAGGVGEFVTATGSSVPLTTNVAVNATSISLTPGDWDVTCGVYFLASATVLTGVSAGISTTSLTVGPTGSYMQYAGPSFLAFGTPVPTVRLSLAATTTVFIVTTATFASGTAAVTAILSARRRR